MPKSRRYSSTEVSTGVSACRWPIMKEFFLLDTRWRKRLFVVRVLAVDRRAASQRLALASQRVSGVVLGARNGSNGFPAGMTNRRATPESQPQIRSGPGKRDSSLRHRCPVSDFWGLVELVWVYGWFCTSVAGNLFGGG
jgi:hypothetical protein